MYPNENVTIIKSYNFVDPNGTKLLLQFGYFDNGTNRCKVPVYRAFGKRIPFPVFGGLWFVGIPFPAMRNFLFNAGYRLETEVSLPSGRANRSCLLPEESALLAEKGNELDALARAIHNEDQDCEEHEAKTLYELLRKMTNGNVASYNVIAYKGKYVPNFDID